MCTGVVILWKINKYVGMYRFPFFLKCTHPNRHYLPRKGTQSLANPVTNKKKTKHHSNVYFEIAVGFFSVEEHNTQKSLKSAFLVIEIRNWQSETKFVWIVSPSSSEMNICQRYSLRKLQFPSVSPLSSSSGSSECLSMKTKKQNKFANLWTQMN